MGFDGSDVVFDREFNFEIEIWWIVIKIDSSFKFESEFKIESPPKTQIPYNSQNKLKPNKTIP